MHAVLRSLARRAKRIRTIRIGPVAVIFRFARAVRVSSNARRRLARAWRRAPAVPLRADLLATDVLPVAPTDEPTAALAPPRVPPPVAMLVGVGPGLGHSLARRLVEAGMRVAMLSRNAERLDPLAEELAQVGTARAYGCDATDEGSVERAMRELTRELGAPELMVYCVERFHPGAAIDTEPAALEESWRHTCLGAFVTARAAARAMVPNGRGTIVFMGCTSSTLGRPGYLNLSVSKFGVRAMAQVMARELWPEGVHVAHVLIDGGMWEPELYVEPGRTPIDPDAVAETVYALHRQPKSSWTHELDIRPFSAKWWQRC